MGRPLAAMLANLGATVYSIDAHSTLLFKNNRRLRRITNTTLQHCLLQSSIVVSAVPSPDFLIPSDAILPNTTLVNVAEFQNIPIDILEKVEGVHFVPQVGKVTVAALEHNLINLYYESSKKKGIEEEKEATAETNTHTLSY